MENRPKSISSHMRDFLASELEIRVAESAEERRERGRGLCEALPHETFASWSWEREDRDPVGVVLSQDATRIEELVGVRHERMAASPFAFYRGSALLMATDLASMPTTGIEVQACGDAHIGNFGIFRSPERRMVWDINDFDETCRGPWEWDVARLCASVELCARARGFSKKETKRSVKAAARGYREAMRRFAKMGTLEMWNEHYDMGDMLLATSATADDAQRAGLEQVVDGARRKDSLRAVRKLTEVVDGRLQVMSQPPLIVPVRDLLQGREILGGKRALGRMSNAVIAAYRSTLGNDSADLLGWYHPVDLARKVVGVGSVGLRAWILVCEGVSPDDVLVLQVKEAQPSVIEAVRGRRGFRHNGQRVVEGQRKMQVATDPLLGWTRLPDAGDTRMRDYYVRQLWDGKGAPDLTTISAPNLTMLADICGSTIAHAHARTGDRFAIAGYLGKGDSFDKALRKFARSYADQVEADHDAFVAAMG